MIQQQTLTGGILLEAYRWLESRNETVSQLLGCTVTNLSLIRSQLGAVLAALAVIFCADGTGLYGWAALFGTEAAHQSLPVIREFMQKGGKQ